MGILDKLGLKKKKQEVVKEAAAPAVVPAAAKSDAPAPREKSKSDTGQAYHILFRPVVSEKGTHLANSGRYVFAVHPKANKSEIRKSVERVYDVHVEKVGIVKMRPKLRRYGRTAGKTAAWKKAVITVREGEKIPGIIESVG